MSNVFDDMLEAVLQAEQTLQAADNVATNMARLLKSRLRHVKQPWILAELKRELQGFDAHKREWKP